MDLRETKKQIRKNILSLRDNMSEKDREIASLYITDRLLSDQWFYTSKNLLIYKSYSSEIKTDYIIDEALKKNMNVFLPKLVDKEMIFIKIETQDNLIPNRYGIKEPQDGEIYKYSSEHDTLVIMPGAVFDKYNNRYGYGGGYYDRFLSDKPTLNTRSIAIGFKCQMVNELICEDTDIKPYRVMCV